MTENRSTHATIPYIVACIPAYNEEKTIAKVILAAKKYVSEVIVCDDGSTDMTAEIAQALGAIVIKHGCNMGYGTSLRTLFQKARELKADIMITLDADAQHDPSQIPKLIKPILNGEADIVIGSRFLDEKSLKELPRYRKQGIQIITKIAKLASYNNLTDAQSGFRAYNKKAINLLSPSEYGMGASTELLIKAKQHNLRVVEVPATIHYGEDTSTQNPVSHGLEVVLSIIKHLSLRRPLLFYGIPGIIAMAIALVLWAWLLQIYITTHQLSTNIALIAIGATMTGLTLLTTAILLWVLVSAIRERE